MTQKERVQELLKLIEENPELPILPLVEGDVVTDDTTSLWMAYWGRAEVRKYWLGKAYFHLYEPDDWGSVEAVFSDMETNDLNGLDQDFEDMSEEQALAVYEDLTWGKAIFVGIEPLS